MSTLIVRTTVVDLFVIPSGSMEPTLMPGERIVADLRVDPSQLRRGDVVVFDGRGSFSPYKRASSLDPLLRVLHVSGQDDVFVKRIIGVGGDSVACCDANGNVTVNGVALSETYLYPGDAPSKTRFSVVVPQGSLWLMGDHRSASADSRSLIGAPGGGMVSTSRVLGRVTRVVWPLPAARDIPSSGEQ